MNLTARIQVGQRRESVLLSSLSSRGAFLEQSDGLPVGTAVRLEFDLPTDSFRLFARVVYRAEEDPDLPFSNSGVGVAFYGTDRLAQSALLKAVSERAARYIS